MAHLLKQTINTKSRSCTTCGKPIRQMRVHQTVRLLLQGTLAQHRGSKCINCGEVSCFECSKGQRRCLCGSNAWIALPYIEATDMAAQTQLHI